jgi:hypothetical protein
MIFHLDHSKLAHRIRRITHQQSDGQPSGRRDQLEREASSIALLGQHIDRMWRHGPVGLVGTRRKLLHRWANGVLISFLLIFLALMIVTLRVKLSRPIWVVPICAALGYPAASLAYIIYFSAFEPQRIINSFGQSGPATAIFMLLLAIPTGSFAWLFGAIAGVAFLLLSRLLENPRHLKPSRRL